MKNFPIATIATSLIASLAEAFVLQSPVSSCAKLAHFNGKSLGTTIHNATLVPRGGLNISNVFNDVAFCQVAASVSYTNKDTLNFQLWLPEESIYQGRFMAVGGGGMAGVIDASNMMQQLNKGFAVAGGDSGHRAVDNNNGGGTPGVYLPYLHDVDQVKAWIHNAISILTQPAKSLVQQYYGAPARYSYYDGCSTGGAQGFALAQFHPDLFDGIYAGSPGNWYSHLALSFLWNGLKTQNESHLNQDLLNVITNAVLDQCDTIDGVADRLIENPLLCNFDISKLACNSSTKDTSNCLTPPQLAAAKAVYAGPTSSINGAQLYPGFSFGSETEWTLQEQSLSNAFSIPILQNLVYDNLHYDYTTFNFGSDVKDVDQKAGTLIDEITTDLTAFKRSGGKLLVTQGWADPYNAAIWPIQHMQDVQNFFKGADISDFFNLFMIPGGGHCGAASNYPDVPATYHVIDKLVQWVERREKPDYVLSTNPPNKNSKVMSRRLCPWPQTAKYVPGGDENNWASYVCEG
ncbi:tannase and feruloyl esterase [Xylogone sp. PMI_703]|nr:tannase and feruloyl esterase [Xylogone sp. PMI_703]